MFSQYLLLILILTATPAHAVEITEARDTYSPFEVEIKTEKEVYSLGEEIEGEVVLYHHYPANLPGNFTVEIYHNGEKISEHLTSVDSVPMGHTDFDFKSFGIPSLYESVTDLGEWKFRVFPQNDPARAAEIIVHVKD